MKHTEGSAGVGLLAIIIFFFFSGCWFVNAYKLTQCDFESPYKCEAIHAAGLIGAPLAAVTVWFDPKEGKL